MSRALCAGHPVLACQASTAMPGRASVRRRCCPGQHDLGPGSAGV